MGRKKRDAARRTAAHPAHTTSVTLGLLLIVTVIAYAPALRAQYVWDDDEYVTGNPAVQQADGLSTIWLEPRRTPAYYPLVFSSFWVEYHLWGDRAIGYHAVNVALHCMNVLLAWLLLRRLAVPGAMLAVAIFALHPVHAESVSWVTERKDVLSGMFILLAIIAWVRFVEERRWRHYTASLALHLAAMLSKAVAAAFAPLSVLIVWWRSPQTWRRTLPLTVPFFVVSLALALVARWRESIDATFDEQRNLAESLLLASRNIAFYAQKFVWPDDLMAIYPKWQIVGASPGEYVWVLTIAVAAAVLWLMRRSVGNVPLAGFVFFICMHLPTLGLVNFNFMNYSYVADRYQYIAILGLAALIGAMAHAVVHRVAWLRGSGGRALAAGAAAAMCLVLAMLTWNHAGAYHDTETLARDTLQKHPEAWSASALLGFELVRRGQFVEGSRELESAVRINPEFALAQYNLAVVRYRMGRTSEAVTGLLKTIEIDPDYPDAHYVLGVILTRSGRPEEAIPYLDKAVERTLSPTSRELGSTPAAAISALADAQAMNGEYARAAELYARVLGDYRNAATPYTELSHLVNTWRSEGSEAAMRVLRDRDGSDDAWPAPVFRFLAGETTAEELVNEAELRVAGRGDEGQRSPRLCEAHYYVGMRDLIEGREQDARRSFEACMATQSVNHSQYHMARHELQRMR
jgi:tetratricopeptide (TPR) repeat protein